MNKVVILSELNNVTRYLLPISKQLRVLEPQYKFPHMVNVLFSVLTDLID